MGWSSLSKGQETFAKKRYNASEIFNITLQRCADTEGLTLVEESDVRVQEIPTEKLPDKLYNRPPAQPVFATFQNENRERVRYVYPCVDVDDGRATENTLADMVKFHDAYYDEAFYQNNPTVKKPDKVIFFVGESAKNRAHWTQVEVDHTGNPPTMTFTDPKRALGYDIKQIKKVAKDNGWNFQEKYQANQPFYNGNDCGRYVSRYARQAALPRGVLEGEPVSLALTEAERVKDHEALTKINHTLYDTEKTDKPQGWSFGKYWAHNWGKNLLALPVGGPVWGLLYSGGRAIARGIGRFFRSIFGGKRKSAAVSPAESTVAPSASQSPFRSASALQNNRVQGSTSGMVEGLGGSQSLDDGDWVVEAGTPERASMRPLGDITEAQVDELIASEKVLGGRLKALFNQVENDPNYSLAKFGKPYEAIRDELRTLRASGIAQHPTYAQKFEQAKQKAPLECTLIEVLARVDRGYSNQPPMTQAGVFYEQATWAKEDVESQARVAPEPTTPQAVTEPETKAIAEYIAGKIALGQQLATVMSQFDPTQYDRLSESEKESFAEQYESIANELAESTSKDMESRADYQEQLEAARAENPVATGLVDIVKGTENYFSMPMGKGEKSLKFESAYNVAKQHIAEHSPPPTPPPTLG